MVYGEGAAKIVLESREHAERRGVRPLARVAGCGIAYEPAAETQQPTGDAIRRAIRAALGAAGLKSFHIGHVNAHGNSTREDDRDRGPGDSRHARRRAGDRAEELSSATGPRQRHGRAGREPAGLRNGVVPPTLNYETPDPECPVNVVTEVQPTEQPAFMKLNHNTTGQAAAVVVTALIEY